MIGATPSIMRPHYRQIPVTVVWRAMEITKTVSEKKMGERILKIDQVKVYV